VEAAGGVVRQQDPGGGDIAGRVARAEVVEVEHAAEGAVGGEEAGRVHVAWSHTAGLVQPGAATVSWQTAGIASGSGSGSGSGRANDSALSDSGTPRPRPTGASWGAGRCRACRNAAWTSADSAGREALGGLAEALRDGNP
jgi:hypothetical protein